MRLGGPLQDNQLQKPIILDAAFGFQMMEYF
jgi:hypothetical protein